MLVKIKGETNDPYGDYVRKMVFIDPYGIKQVIATARSKNMEIVYLVKTEIHPTYTATIPLERIYGLQWLTDPIPSYEKEGYLKLPGCYWIRDSICEVIKRGTQNEDFTYLLKRKEDW